MRASTGCSALQAELELDQQRPDVTLDQPPDRGTPVKQGVKSQCRDPGGGAGHADDGRDGRW
jgi:hypothetical protein